MSLKGSRHTTMLASPIQHQSAHLPAIQSGNGRDSRACARTVRSVTPVLSHGLYRSLIRTGNDKDHVHPWSHDMAIHQSGSSRVAVSGAYPAP
nr:hypothetical protein CFP56_42146 [Quercus suber]